MTTTRREHLAGLIATAAAAALPRSLRAQPADLPSEGIGEEGDGNPW
jgi:hypothetical protein